MGIFFKFFYLSFVWVWGVNHVMFGWNGLGLRKMGGWWWVVPWRIGVRSQILDGGSVVVIVFFFFLNYNLGFFGFEVWIMWCLMLGTVWVRNWWVGSDGWCCGGQQLLGHVHNAHQWVWVLFWILFYFLDLFEVWCKRIYLWLDVGWLISWVDLCLIALCDTGSNWVDLGLMEGGFLFLECNVNFYFS